MSRPIVSDTYPPRITFTTTPQAYGLRAVPRFVREIADDQIVIRRRALNALAEYLVNPLHVHQCLEEGVVSILKQRLLESDFLVRERTTYSLELLARQGCGIEAIILGHILEELRQRLDDEEVPVRISSYKTLIHLSMDIRGAYEIANYDLIPTLVEKLVVEPSASKKLVFEILHYLMSHDGIRPDFLSTPAMKYFTDHLKGSDDEIQKWSARCIGDLSVEANGKSQGNQCGTVEVLAGMLLKDDLQGPLPAVTYALMMILVNIEARYRFLRTPNVLERLLILSKHPCPEVALNAIKIATLIAESPEGREFFLKNLQKVEDMQKKPDPLVRSVAKTLLEVTTWKP